MREGEEEELRAAALERASARTRLEVTSGAAAAAATDILSHIQPVGQPLRRALRHGEGASGHDPRRRMPRQSASALALRRRRSLLCYRRSHLRCDLR